ncbi:MAG: hypothetical protein EA425_14160 [Puniceicoccaceae bacterium]|nr:MAG: hypothetical protein EA425_14160 [Puniceicoccaceae bacterium]
MIDAYCHAGGPRFGSADLALRELDRYGITHANLVLPPGCPDFAALRRARALRGDAVRCFGIPFGDSEKQRTGLTDWQIRAGISGLRLMPEEVAANPGSLALLGEAGRWLFAINPCDRPETIDTLLSWLEHYTTGRIACPHFLKPGGFRQTLPDPERARAFLAHPRVAVIFSRQGNTGTTRPYPHEDLRPWIDEVVAAAGWEKILWGSEYPVLYWRDELIPQATDWIRNLLPDLADSSRRAFLGENARRLFFFEPAPDDDAGDPPGWVPPPLHTGYPVPIAQKGLRLSSAAVEKLTAAYLEANTPGSPVTLSAFLAEWIESRLPR